MASIPGVAFDENAVIAGLHTAMQVGLPVDEESRPKFFWPTTIITDDSKDSAENVPFNPASRPTHFSPDPVQVPCAITYQNGPGKVVDYGVTVPSKVILTLIQPDYDQVNDDTKGGMFQYVVIGGDRWFYHHEEPPLGLVSLGIHQIECHAESDS